MSILKGANTDRVLDGLENSPEVVAFRDFQHSDRSGAWLNLTYGDFITKVVELIYDRTQDMELAVGFKEHLKTDFHGEKLDLQKVISGTAPGAFTHLKKELASYLNDYFFKPYIEELKKQESFATNITSQIMQKINLSGMQSVTLADLYHELLHSELTTGAQDRSRLAINLINELLSSNSSFYHGIDMLDVEITSNGLTGSDATIQISLEIFKNLANTFAHLGTNELRRTQMRAHDDLVNTAMSFLEFNNLTIQRITDRIKAHTS